MVRRSAALKNKSSPGSTTATTSSTSSHGTGLGGGGARHHGLFFIEPWLTSMTKRHKDNSSNSNSNSSTMLLHATPASSWSPEENHINGSNHPPQQSSSMASPPPPESAARHRFGLVFPSPSSLLSSNTATLMLTGGCSAAVFTSVMKHPQTTLTPLSGIYLLLLALQYALQPRLSRRYIHKQTNKQTVALAEEGVKTGMAAVLWTLGNLSKQQQQSAAVSASSWFPADWSVWNSWTVAGLPAVIYAIQGVLQYTAHQHVDAVTYNGLTQTKTLFAALCCYWIMGKPQSPLQMVALLGLFVSAMLFQSRSNPTSAASTATTTGASSSKVATQDKQQQVPNTDNNNSSSHHHSHAAADWFLLGVIPCLAATFCSGLAGAMSQRGLQLAGGGGGGGGRDPYFYTMEISLFSALTLILHMLLPSSTTTDITQKNSNNNKLFVGWTRETWIPILWKAAGGVLTALVHKHAGSVVKGFALMMGLVLSGMLQPPPAPSSSSRPESHSDRNGGGSRLTPHQLAGTLLVLASGWLHFTNPPVVATK